MINNKELRTLINKFKSYRNANSNAFKILHIRDLFESREFDQSKLHIVNHRHNLWTLQHKKNYIDDLLHNRPCGSFIFCIQEDKIEIIKGFQRLLAIVEFLNDNFDISFQFLNMMDKNYYYSELPREVKILINNTELWYQEVDNDNLNMAYKEHIKKLCDRTVYEPYIKFNTGLSLVENIISYKDSYTDDYYKSQTRRLRLAIDNNTAYLPPTWRS